MYIKRIITLDEFKKSLKEKFNDSIEYREEGKNGWIQIIVEPSGIIMQQEKGVHWIDAYSVPNRSGTLVGTYNVSTGEATFFI